MNTQDYYKRPLIKVLCVKVTDNGRRCFHWLGDFIYGVHTVQNFRCQKCNQEWLVEKDKADVMTYIRIPKSIKKDYRNDTGFKIELHQDSLADSDPAYNEEGGLDGSPLNGKG